MKKVSYEKQTELKLSDNCSGVEVLSCIAVKHKHLEFVLGTILKYISPLIITKVIADNLVHVYLVVCRVSDSVQKIPKWNFWKFLVNPEGKVVRFWRTDEPMESIRKEVTALVREIILKKRVEL